MTDTLLLEMYIKRAGLTKREVANRLGISEMGLYKKVNNITEFKAGEIAKLYKILKLNSLTEQQSIFFANFVDLNSTKIKINNKEVNK